MATKPDQATAEALASRHGATQYRDGYDEAVTALKSLRKKWGDAAMYKNGTFDNFVVYAWYDGAGKGGS